MQKKWITPDKQNPRLILYFAGWGTSPELVSGWQLPQNCDALLIWDYRDLKLDFDFSQYSQIHLIAWSMGVWAAEQSIGKLPLNSALNSALAINGTPTLRDDKYGIPTAIFDGTLNNFNEITRLKFERRMCSSSELLKQYQETTPRPTQEIAQELKAVANMLAGQNTTPHIAPQINWTKAIIGEKDSIFPAENQKRYWQQKTCQIKQIPAPHFALPFLNAWDGLC